MDIIASPANPSRLPWLAVLAVVAALVVSCAERPSFEAPPPSPHIREARAEMPALTIRLPELLPVAQVEREVGRIDFSALEEAATLLFEGWSHEPDLGIAWGTGEISTLEFVVVPERDLVLRFRCAPFHFPGSERQVVTVIVNGHELEQVELWRMTRSYSVNVPASILRAGANRLEFRYAYAAVPAEVLEESADDRRVAVMWHSIRLIDLGEEVPAPRASSDRTRLDLPFATSVSFFLELGTDSALRIGGLEVWGKDGGPTDGMRLRLETTVDPGVDVRRVELAPDQLDRPVELQLPVEATGQLVRVTLAAYRLDDSSDGALGFSIDLPEVVSGDEALAPMAAADPPPPASRRSERPNILIYMVDTLRADHLGAYGYDVPTSPNIDRFAADATLFERATAQTSWTKPAVASIFTGLHPQAHGTNERTDALAREAQTVAETLWEDGYDTAAIFANGNLYHTGLGQGFKTYRYLREGDHHEFHVLSDRLNRAAFNWLDDRDESKPFFLYLHAVDPHSPYTPPPGFLEQTGKTVKDPDAGLLERVNELGRDGTDADHLADLVALYDAEIAHNDHSFGRLIEELKRRGLYESTMIVLVSDHGEEFFDHGWWQHGKTLYEEQLAVPLIIRFPHGVGAGTRDATIAQHIDLLPTILDLVGIEQPAELSGRSLFPGSGSTDDRVLAVSYLSVDDRVAESLVWEQAKLVLHYYDLQDGRLLFDLSEDPAEQRNLWTERPVLYGYLMSALRAFHLAQRMQLEPEESDFDEEQIERLRALGYLN